jgi:hypothetical protein
MIRKEEHIMDEQTKKLIGVVLILLGIAAVGVIAWDYLYYLDSPKGHWRWTSGEVFQIIAGFISVGTGFSILNRK